MNFIDAFLFLTHFDPRIPQSFLLWLSLFPKTQQDAFLTIILKAKKLKLKPKLKCSFSGTMPISHNNECECEKYYVQLNETVKFPRIYGRCLGNFNFTEPEPQFKLSTFCDYHVNALDFKNVQYVKTHNLKNNKLFRVFPDFVIRQRTLTMHAFLKLITTVDFDIMRLGECLNVVEVGMIYNLIYNEEITGKFVEKFLPTYCRSLRYVESSGEEIEDILKIVYDKLLNRNLTVKFPNTSYISMALRPIKYVNELGGCNSVIQFGYVGERFVLHVYKNKLYVCNDYGEHMGVYSINQKSPFNVGEDCVLECIRTKQICYLVDVYAKDRISLYDRDPYERAKILSKISVSSGLDFEIAPIISCNNIKKYMDLSDQIIKHGYDLVYDSLIIRSTDFNYIGKYELKKFALQFDQFGIVCTSDVLYSYSGKYEGYFLLKRSKNTTFSINIWNVYDFQVVGYVHIKSKFLNGRLDNLIAKISFNSVHNNLINEITSIRIKKYKSIYNCIGIKEWLQIKQIKL